MPTRATIMGLGRFGGGVGAVRHLAEQCDEIIVTDLAPASELASAIEHIQDLVDAGVVTLRLGEHNVSDFTTVDLVVANPAVKKPWENRFIRSAQAAGVRLTTEIGLLIDALSEGCTTIAVTAGAGKSTTSAMIHAGMLAAGRDSFLGGNIGGSLLPRVSEIGPDAALVLELSSAMLWWLTQPGATHRNSYLSAGVITNIAPNHIDWHGSEDHYRASKLAIAQLLKPDAPLLVGEGVHSPTPHAVRIEPAPDLPDLCTPGAHNRTNAAAALMACTTLGAGRKQAMTGIADFPGLPHRLEFVREIRGVHWYNDSKSTTPDATRLAIEALAPAPVHLIVGGSDKGVDLSPIADLAQRAASVSCIGQTGETIARMIGIASSVTLERAVREIHERAQEGDAVVLSPGCASFDQFRHFEHRGDVFRELVHSLS